MSGGSSEYVMGIMLDKNGNLVSGRNDNFNSNFVGTLTYMNDAADPTKTSWTTEDGGVEWPDKRYYDTYAYFEGFQQYGRRILGDATGELGGFEYVTYTGTTTSGTTASRTVPISSWNEDLAHFVSYGNPWFLRGSDYQHGLNSGLGAFGREYGRSIEWGSFRIVLTP